MDSLLGNSITYRIALGPRAGQKAFTLLRIESTGAEVIITERAACRDI